MCPPEDPPAGVCIPHSDWEPRNTRWWKRETHACSCGPVLLFRCECCRRYNVPTKSKGIGYWCGGCMAHWDAESTDEVEADHRRAEFVVL